VEALGLPGFFLLAREVARFARSRGILAVARGAPWGASWPTSWTSPPWTPCGRASSLSASSTGG
jgi:hypothetical protein